MVWQTVLWLSTSLRGTFSTWICFTGINKYGKGAVVQLCTVFRPDYDGTCGAVVWNGTFLDIYLTIFFLVRNLKNTFKLWGWYFFRKCSKLNLNLQNAKENSENIFRFWDNCIWKCCLKLSLLKRDYLLSAANELRNSPKIPHNTQRHFFNPNCLHMD